MMHDHRSFTGNRSKWRKRDILGGFLTCLMFMSALVGLLVIGGAA